jgi:LTXXQ motif family protein
MMKRFSNKIVAASAFVTALGGTLLAFPLILDNPAFALDAKGAAPGQDEHHHWMLPSERVEPRLAYLKTALKITDAQTKQWNAFADVLRKQAKDRDAKIEAMRAKFEANKDKPRPEVSAIDRMERREKMMTEASAELSERLAAVRPLYAALSDDQKQTADELLAHRGGHGGFGHHGGFGGGEH